MIPRAGNFCILKVLRRSACSADRLFMVSIDLDKPCWSPSIRNFVSMEYFKAGKIVSTHGLKGELLLKHSFGKKTSLKGLRAIFIEEKAGSMIPWFIESTRIKGDEETFLKLEGVNTREAASRLTMKEVWLPEAEFKDHAAKSAPANLLGYDVINEARNLGKVQEVIDQPHQLLCRIEMEGKEVLVPLNESTLRKIDHKHKRVIVSLPAGLLDIYLT